VHDAQLNIAEAALFRQITYEFPFDPGELCSHLKRLQNCSLSVGTSIDALAIGLSLAMLEGNIWYPAIIIGVITSVMSLLAIGAGIGMGKYSGSHMEVIGGIILIFIGTRILFVNLI